MADQPQNSDGYAPPLTNVPQNSRGHVHLESDIDRPQNSNGYVLLVDQPQNSNRNAFSDVRPQNRNVELPDYALFCMITAALAGLLYGYNIGISGGVIVMDDFLIKFFPKVHKNNPMRIKFYCKYDDPFLQLFTSSLYFSVIPSSFVAPFVLKNYGHKATILLAAAFFIIGAAICSSAVNYIMLIFGRIISGLGAGFGNVAVPLFLFEVLPVQRKECVIVSFQFLIETGIFIAYLVNDWSSKLQYAFGWRVSMGMAGIPALFLLFGGIFITETPATLIERGKDSAALDALIKIRHIIDVRTEFNQIKIITENTKKYQNPYKNLLQNTHSSPLITIVALQIYQQMIGINAILFYAPILFKSTGRSLYAVFFCLVIVKGLLISFCIGDKVIRIISLTAACMLMVMCQMTFQYFIVSELLTMGGLKPTQANILLWFMSVFVMVFACSWGPLLGWTFPIETFTQETRTTSFAFAVISTMFWSFLTAQVFLSAMCHFGHFGPFVFSFLNYGVASIGLLGWRKFLNASK
ncbi:hypothetical protein ACFE04_005423 [Oxalis oulophora]